MTLSMPLAPTASHRWRWLRGRGQPHHLAIHARGIAAQGLHSLRAYDRLALPLVPRDLARRRVEACAQHLGRERHPWNPQAHLLRP
jgi:hypothetical protein